MGFKPSKADPDLWIRDAGDHYEYIVKNINDIWIMSKDLMSILNKMERPSGLYDSKGIGSPKYYLGSDIKIICQGNSIEQLSLSSKTYIKSICKN